MHNIAVAGNPNSGKTCIFNNITGSSQQVGNYPGVTVELVEGATRIEAIKYNVIDLPGTYSLTAYSQEELVARDYIIQERPDVIINVLDASNLERNLYLTVQLLELKRPMVIALNMVDVAQKKGAKINSKLLGDLLGIKVVETVASKKTGMDELKQACADTIRDRIIPKTLSYSHELSGILVQLENTVKDTSFAPNLPPRWLALKLLEEDEEVLRWLEDFELKDKVIKALKDCERRLMAHSGEDTVTAVAEARYGIACGIVRKTVAFAMRNKKMLTDRIDSVVCNRFLGPVILFAVVYALFFLVFKVSDDTKWIPLFNGQWASPVGVFDMFFEWLAYLTDKHVADEMVKSLLRDGIIGGVGGVMGFVPLVFIMFFFISILEDTGYIARIAFILDRVLRVFGLQGKSILSLIVSGGLGGGGCAVPGIMATRTLREEKDRLVTIMVVPMMNCGAKMPVYAMLIAAFFSSYRGPVMFILWLLSWIFALSSAFILRKYVIKGEQTPFVMELPVYHMPTARGVMIHTWNRTWMYIKKAGTVILGINVIFWLMIYFPRQDPKPFEKEMTQIEQDFAKSGKATPEVKEKYLEALSKVKKREAAEQLRNSVAGRIGVALEPLSRFAGFNWKINIALLGGFAAKEVVVGTLGTVYSMEVTDPENSESLSAKIAGDKDWNPLKALALMIFVMLYSPCIPAVAAIKKETNSWRWAAFSTVYSTVFAFLLVVAIYQMGKLII